MPDPQGLGLLRVGLLTDCRGSTTSHPAMPLKACNQAFSC
jgi:hypothetical protein